MLALVYCGLLEHLSCELMQFLVKLETCPWTIRVKITKNEEVGMQYNTISGNW